MLFIQSDVADQHIPNYLAITFMNQNQAISLYQPLLVNIAYSLVRCREDAEDIVQETLLKWLTVDQQKIDNIKSYLTKAVTNTCLNHLQTLKRKKEELLNSVNIKEALNRFIEINFSHLDLDARLQTAFAIIHERLEPLERAIFLLKEVFDVDYDVIQEAFDKKKEHCRQLFCRAKKKIRTNTGKTAQARPTLMMRFKESCHSGHVSDLIGELKNDILTSFGKKI